jgi:probable HAF family extracellular repeat protein
MYPMYLRIVLCIACPGILTAVSNSIAAPPSFMGLGNVPPGSGFMGEVYGISGNGTVGVGAYDSGTAIAAVRYTLAGGMVALGHLRGGSFAGARAASSDGTVLVGFSSTNSGGSEAVRWAANGAAFSLGMLPGADLSDAWGVSGDGSVIVGGSNDHSNYAEAFRWSNDSGLVGLGDLDGSANGVYSYAYNVSQDGSVIVGVSAGISGGEAFRWTSKGMVGLGFPSPGYGYSEAQDLSADGSVIVGIADNASGGQPFRWTSSTGMSALGALSNGTPFSQTLYTRTCRDGSLVVGDSNGKAFIWDAAHGMRDFKNVLVSEFGLNLTDWTLDTAFGISDDCSTILGNGVNPSGAGEVYMAIIPEPATLGLLLPAALAIVSCRSVKSRSRATEWRKRMMT